MLSPVRPFRESIPSQLSALSPGHSYDREFTGVQYRFLYPRLRQPSSSLRVSTSPEQYTPLTCTPFFSHDNNPVSFETQSISHLFASQPTLERTSAYALFPLPLANSAASSTREDPVPLCPIWVENSIARAPQLHSPCQVPR